jgi:hypothetical protein
LGLVVKREVEFSKTTFNEVDIGIGRRVLSLEEYSIRAKDVRDNFIRHDFLDFLLVLMKMMDKFHLFEKTCLKK